ncbi:phytosulfokine receptor 1-like [Phoenix dactylifera]|uniref:non-specific serine/threonine protein kinase n=1 Tax=Phoenix dactylifera TaxID=42345 RepID=A0A8B8ZPW3_PHODC|nr:phytosulfokine receptor 1-like [Phoenix dactylifera]
MGDRGDPKWFLFMHTWCLLLYFFLFFFFIPTNSQNQTCNSGDLHALQGFSSALDGGIQGWSFDSSPIDCCTWAGVLCDRPTGSERRVIGLDLQNKSLKGSLSDSLTGLDQLRWLNLSYNSLEGLVPLQLLHHPRLEHLDLSSNDLSGPIPLDVYLPSIRVFNISYNMFNGSHPILSGSTNLEEFDISFNGFVGLINPGICNSSTRIQILQFSMNAFTGGFPVGFGNCNSLVELSLYMNDITGNLPEDLFKLSSLKSLYLQENRLFGRMSTRFSNLSNLAQLDLSFNLFSGNIPNVFGSLMLEYFCAQSNSFHGSLPASLANLPSLRVLNLRNNSLSGHITLNCTAMTHLSFIDLATNSLTGPIPYNISQCVELKTLNLARNSLTGEIPISFKNLSSLSHLSLSNNSISNLSLALEILQDCPSLNSLVLTKNFFDGERMPMDGIQGFQNIEVLVIANCDLLGSIPLWLLNCRKLKVLDLSWNRLDGTIPLWIGYYDHLFYLDLSNNSFTGEIPSSFAQMKGLISPNNLQQGTTMEDFPFFIKKNMSGKGLQYNQVSSFPPSLILSNNMLVGPILPGFGDLKQLHVLDLSKNRLSGTIPDELSGMSSLETLDMSHNNLTGGIPLSLTRLNFLSSFSVAYNNLVGSIPTGGQFSTFSSTAFDGNPGLCGPRLPSCDSKAPIQTVSQGQKNKGVIIGMAVGIGLGTAFLLAIIYLFVSRTHSNSRRQEDTVKVVADANGNLESAASTLVLLFQNKDNKELSIRDILKSTDNFDQANIVGCGGFGLVFKAVLPDGSKVAIKRLSGDYGQMEKEFQAEVQALSRAQHRNLVLLQGYCRIGSDRLLIYSYMEHGSLDYWLHERQDGGSMLDWEKRLQIAQGSARGLAYLHQSCQPHILHRDIKSSNILLDENFEAHLADFGLARLILPCDTHVTTDLVGTLGYIPPEYGQSSAATFKGDIYSFGVVLLELLTGKRPVDMCRPKGGRDLISWVLQMRKEKRENEVFDPFIYDKEHDSQMKQMLEIACLCLNDSPKLRPLSHQLVAWLENIGLDGCMTK